ncbi:hypothetical protein [Mucilaginibacter kameinonensis]|uniref:hypothetical protein n=1 Tax=Mucilaginibacter kameinonensis TaxID=452286 RepID=UPI000EF76767|nr:hypothetical protein [Mucilaginibacter kameinonensis]
MNQPKSEIFSDGICVYVSVNVSNPFIGKLALVFANLLILTVIGLGVVWHIPGMVICFGLLFVLLAKYSLWNFFGWENLIINTRSVSYQRDYGLFKTRYIIKRLQSRLIISHSLYKPNPGCILRSFGSYKQVDNTPFEIYNMTFPMAEADAKYLNTLIEKLFIDDMSRRYDLPQIILN